MNTGGIGGGGGGCGVITVKMVTLPAFDRGRACVKCGSIGARVEWEPASEAESASWPAEREHLKRSCGECGYSWQEATLDSGVR